VTCHVATYRIAPATRCRCPAFSVANRGAALRLAASLAREANVTYSVWCLAGGKLHLVARFNPRELRS
jgi:hypothetical protein